MKHCILNGQSFDGDAVNAIGDAELKYCYDSYYEVY